jgi:hypothetical protein
MSLPQPHHLQHEAQPHALIIRRSALARYVIGCDKAVHLLQTSADIRQCNEASSFASKQTKPKPNQTSPSHPLLSRPLTGITTLSMNSTSLLLLPPSSAMAAAAPSTSYASAVAAPPSLSASSNCRRRRLRRSQSRNAVIKMDQRSREGHRGATGSYLREAAVSAVIDDMRAMQMLST